MLAGSTILCIPNIIIPYYHPAHGFFVDMSICYRGEVAQGKPASQVSTARPFAPCLEPSASLAVDGNTNPALLEGCTCTHTAYPLTAPMWWIVDLLDSYIVYNLTIYNRADGYGKLTL